MSVPTSSSTSLGEGGIGQVFKARHASLDRVVALKVLRSELVTDSETVGRFYREIKVSGQLPDHPNLIRAFDAGQAGATHFLAMEYVEGTDLDRLVKQSGPLGDRAGLRHSCARPPWGCNMLIEHGLVHRDIKPSNLLVTGNTPRPHVKILDLGLARLHSDSGTSPAKAPS